MAGRLFGCTKKQAPGMPGLSALAIRIRKKGKGTTRDCLVNCFEKVLEIRTIDGIEWVSLPQTTSDVKTDSETEKKSNEPELSAEEAATYNATLAGHKTTSDVKTPAGKHYKVIKVVE